MLTVPSVHPFLTTLVTEHSSGTNASTIIPAPSWNRIVEEAIAQRIVPLLFRWLDHPVRQRQIPPQLLITLKQEIVQHAAWNLLLTHALGDILALCEQRGVVCIPIRGPALEKQLYEDGAVRPMDDLDLLVHREDLSAIKNIFQQLGYTHHEPRPGFLETFSYSLEFIHPSHGFLVEPHWTLAYPPCISTTPMQPVWVRVVRQHWMGMASWALSPEDLILHLCLHLHHKKQQAPLLWFHELNTMIRQQGPALDWNIFLTQVELMDQTTAVADVLILLRKRFHSPIPDAVVKQLTIDQRNTSARSPSARRHQILAQSSRSGREEFALLGSLQHLPQRLWYLSVLLFPSLQYMMRRYGSPSRPRLIGFYIARFFYIVAEGLRCAVTWIGTVVAMRLSSFIRQ